MRLLSFCRFFGLFSVFFLVLLSSAAQTSPPQNSQSPGAAQAAPAQQPSPPAPSGNSGAASSGQAGGQQPAQSQVAPALRRFKIKVRPPLQLPRPLQNLPDGPLDPGIFLRKEAGLNHVCGAIVSYNFSPGPNPQLESVTTCTPAGIVTSRQTDGQKQDQPGPRPLQTKE